MTRFVLLIFLASAVAAGLAGVGSSLVIKQAIDSGNAAQSHRLYLAQVAACGRQNVRTAAANKNALATYRYDTFFAQAVTQPRPNQTAAQKALTHTFLLRLLDTTTTLTWTPLNHRCVKEPTAVQLPVVFSKRKPGKADLTNP